VKKIERGVAFSTCISGNDITWRVADVIPAANTFAEVALRLVRPGTKVTIPCVRIFIQMH
jgi:hypothetical protein